METERFEALIDAILAIIVTIIVAREAVDVPMVTISPVVIERRSFLRGTTISHPGSIFFEHLEICST